MRELCGPAEFGQSPGGVSMQLCIPAECPLLWRAEWEGLQPGQQLPMQSLLQPSTRWRKCAAILLCLKTLPACHVGVADGMSHAGLSHAKLVFASLEDKCTTSTCWPAVTDMCRLRKCFGWLRQPYSFESLCSEPGRPSRILFGT